MSSDRQEKLQVAYQNGKSAFERGEYLRSIKYFEAAHELAYFSSRLGGEIGIWLVTAYQAADLLPEAIAMCQKLERHPSPEIAKQGRGLLYIIRAPKLKRPKEWLTEIPDLAQLSESDLDQRRGSGVKKLTQAKSVLPEAIDPTKVNTQDNQFIWVALGLVLLTLGSLWLIG